MGKYYLGCLIVLLLLAAVPVPAFIFLSPAVASLVSIGYFVLLYLVLRLVLRGLAAGLREAVRESVKLTGDQIGLVEGAAVVVHRFEQSNASLPQMKHDEEFDCSYDEEEHGPARYVLLDCTVSPQLKPGEFWHPFQLGLEQPDLVASMHGQEEEEEMGSVDHEPEMICAIRKTIRILDTEERELEVPDTLHTPARLRMVFACPPKMTGTVQLSYFRRPLTELTMPQGTD